MPAGKRSMAAEQAAGDVNRPRKRGQSSDDVAVVRDALSHS